MKKETLAVETDENSTVTYRNANGKLHNSNGAAVVYSDGDKEYYINGKKLTRCRWWRWVINNRKTT